jgi:glutamine---fructose-6-phosphate transaminase (isomerizing)
MHVTLMEKEAAESPKLVENQLKVNASLWRSICDEVKKHEIYFAMTVARGSSDHAAKFGKFLFETKQGWLTASAAPSIFTVYESALRMKHAFVVGVSQSGQSPDICEVMRCSQAQGALTVALVNKPNSPLAKEAQFEVPLLAGEEVAVAATKSYITSLTALLQFEATYHDNQELLKALELLPQRMQEAVEMDWTPAVAQLHTKRRTMVIARGYAFPVALEMALKFKETSSLQAEAFSSAEVLHGPFALIDKDYTVLVIAQNDATLKGTLDVVEKITAAKGTVLLALPEDIDYTAGENVHILPLPKSLHPLVDPVVVIQAFYMMVARLAVMRGFNPDQPENLKKVTETH